MARDHYPLKYFMVVCATRTTLLLNPQLLQFPSLNAPQTFTLTKQPYIEGGIGIGNIFKIFRIDLTALYLPRQPECFCALE